LDKVTPAVRALLDELTPPGTICAFGGATPPAGWLLCDGRALNSSVYTGLYDAIGTNWGAGTLAIGGTNDFNLPDLRGLFLRGVSGAQSGAFADPDRDSRVASPAGGNAGNAVGSYQVDDLKAHSHEVFPKLQGSTSDYGPYVTSAKYPITKPFTNETGSTGGFETRPKNAYVNYIIKY
jgi:microcystin-dependent protein